MISDQQVERLSNWVTSKKQTLLMLTRAATLKSTNLENRQRSAFLKPAPIELCTSRNLHRKISLSLCVHLKQCFSLGAFNLGFGERQGLHKPNNNSHLYGQNLSPNRRGSRPNRNKQWKTKKVVWKLNDTKSGSDHAKQAAINVCVRQVSIPKRRGLHWRY